MSDTQTGQIIHIKIMARTVRDCTFTNTSRLPPSYSFCTLEAVHPLELYTCHLYTSVAACCSGRGHVPAAVRTGRAAWTSTGWLLLTHGSWANSGIPRQARFLSYIGVLWYALEQDTSLHLGFLTDRSIYIIHEYIRKIGYSNSVDS